MAETGVLLRWVYNHLCVQCLVHFGQDNLVQVGETCVGLSGLDELLQRLPGGCHCLFWSAVTSEAVALSPIPSSPASVTIPPLTPASLASCFTWWTLPDNRAGVSYTQTHENRSPPHPAATGRGCLGWAWWSWPLWLPWRYGSSYSATGSLTAGQSRLRVCPSLPMGTGPGRTSWWPSLRLNPSGSTVSHHCATWQHASYGTRSAWEAPGRCWAAPCWPPAWGSTAWASDTCCSISFTWFL